MNYKIAILILITTISFSLPIEAQDSIPQEKQNNISSTKDSQSIEGKEQEGYKVKHSLISTKSFNVSEPSDSMYQLGLKDAKNFHNAALPFWSNFGVSTICGFIIGWPTAIFTANSEVPPNKIRYPSIERSKNDYYKKGYDDGADEKKAKKCKSGFIIGSITNVVGFIGFISVYNSVK